MHTLQWEAVYCLDFWLECLCHIFSKKGIACQQNWLLCVLECFYTLTTNTTSKDPSFKKTVSGIPQYFLISLPEYPEMLSFLCLWLWSLVILVIIISIILIIVDNYQHLHILISRKWASEAPCHGVSRHVTLPEAAEFLLQTCQHGSYSRVSTADLSARLIQQSFYCRLASTVHTAEFLELQYGSYILQ